MRNIIMDKEGIKEITICVLAGSFVFNHGIWGIYLWCIPHTGNCAIKTDKNFFTRVERTCSINGIPPEELVYVHFPQPKTYSSWVQVDAKPDGRATLETLADHVGKKKEGLHLTMVATNLACPIAIVQPHFSHLA
ncbi:hypothetical protein CK203_083343 [Vitis vinifera]|uniref:Uncharacterized protein n=1 Tax=Vitis vinifera TaxID=29760 RepID=A0A438BW18_VITVI|nr:hypothetical protein CK203_083343 [Vitis vinifera]